MKPIAVKGNNQLLSTKSVAKIGILAGLAAVLMLFEFPLPFVPYFYELDFSEVPILMGALIMGPLAGVIIEVVKILLNLAMNGSITFGIGEFANLCIGCAFIVPAAMIFQRDKTLRGLIIGCVVGTISLGVIGGLLNYFVMLPFYSQFMPINEIIALGQTVNAFVYDMKTLVLFAVVPFNLLKGLLVSVATVLLFKRVGKVLMK